MHATRAPRTIGTTAPLLVAAAVFTAAGGYVHLREWLDTYRDVPVSAPGAALVRIGFPINAGVSVLVAAVLLGCALRATRLTPVAVAAAALFQAGSLITLILTRTGSVLGWSEPVWTHGADQTRAVEIGALLALAAARVIRPAASAVPQRGLNAPVRPSVPPGP